jgi:hypothetical protein
MTNFSRALAFTFSSQLWRIFACPGTQKPGFPLQFLNFTSGKVSGISAAIPCAEEGFRLQPAQKSSPLRAVCSTM